MRSASRSTGIAIGHKRRALFVPRVNETDIAAAIHLGDDTIGRGTNHAESVFDPSARSASITACPAFICAMSYLAGSVPRNLQDNAPEGIIHTENLHD